MMLPELVKGDINKDGYHLIISMGLATLGDNPDGSEPYIWIIPGDIDGFQTTTPFKVVYPGEVNLG